MKIVKCGDNEEREYGLALGPAILLQLKDKYVNIFPKEVIDRMEKFAEANGLNVIDVAGNEELIEKVLGVQEGIALKKANTQHSIDTIKKTIRTFNGERIGNINVFLEEEMDPGDYKQIIGEINDAIILFSTGLEATEKSELLSMVKGEKEVPTTEPILSS